MNLARSLLLSIVLKLGRRNRALLFFLLFGFVFSSTRSSKANLFVCSMLSLAEMFELPPQVVHSIVSKMIINEELQVGSLS